MQIADKDTISDDNDELGCNRKGGDREGYRRKVRGDLHAGSQFLGLQRHIDLFSGETRVAVADATALIKGFSFKAVCDVVVTVQEVMDEVNDSEAFCWL